MQIKLSTVRRLTPMMRAAKLIETNLSTGGPSRATAVARESFCPETPLHPVDSTAA